MYDKVYQFRKRMGLPVADSPTLLKPEDASYFARFIMEELSEFLKANEEQSLIDTADALADLVYVTLGCAHAMGLPFKEIFDVVHDANMAKVPANEARRSARGKAYDVIKPDGWQPPEPRIQDLIIDARLGAFKNTL